MTTVNILMYFSLSRYVYVWFYLPSYQPNYSNWYPVFSLNIIHKQFPMPLVSKTPF